MQYNFLNIIKQKAIEGEKMNRDLELRGLTESEAVASREKYGNNKISEKKKKGFFSQFVANLSDPVIRVLIGALVLNTIFSFGDIDIVETLGIAASVLIATFISTVSEVGSAAAFARICDSDGARRFRVRRAGELCETVTVLINDMPREIQPCAFLFERKQLTE